MAGTKAWRRKATQTNKAKHGSNFTLKIGAKVVKLVTLVVSPLILNWLALLGAKGGLISRRSKKTAEKAA